MVLRLAGRGLAARAVGIKAVVLLGGGGTGVLVAGIVLILVLAVGLGDGAQIGTTAPSAGGGCPIGAPTCAGEAFDPGNIISDNEFYNTTAMTEPQIRDFINKQGAACTGGNCLRAIRVDMSDQPADAYCAALTCGTGLDAAAVIAGCPSRAG